MDNPAASSDLGSLPQWNLGDLYESPKAPGIDSDLARAAAESKELAKRFQGKLAGLDGEELAEAVKAYEALQDVLGKVGSYAQLVYAGNMSDPENGRSTRRSRSASPTSQPKPSSSPSRSIASTIRRWRRS